MQCKALGVGATARIVESGALLTEIDLAELGQPGHAFLAREVMTNIDSDAVKPGAKVLTGSESPEVFKDPQVDILGGIARILAVAEHPPGD